MQTQVGCAAGPSTPWHDHTSRGPYFDRTMTNNVSTTIGRTVLLRCRIFQLDGQAVSWIRKQDLHILTLGAYSYTTDDRFKEDHQQHQEDKCQKRAADHQAQTGRAEHQPP
ncbi:uncharacterized protein LOC122379610 [Amphibalanus amphitrite]|uniref:uncharacterized protein LOC122379610 n=1 Tax=Amphibalanus amphitrite TaxID=1232801 RepID=UPI001C91D29A|nr:uncharacterized protein LOC122379610 [Amphibalanus amphitrite]